jgi:hypothetical protein
MCLENVLQMIVVIQFTDRDGRLSLCGQVYRHCRSNKFEVILHVKVIRAGTLFEDKLTKIRLMPFAVDPKPAAFLQDNWELD